MMDTMRYLAIAALGILAAWIVAIFLFTACSSPDDYSKPTEPTYPECGDWAPCPKPTPTR
jgi:hypothetical protein